MSKSVFIISFLVIFLINNSIAQKTNDSTSIETFNYFVKGNKMIGINPPISWTGFIGLIVNVGGRYSCFIKDKLSIGVESKYISNLGSFTGYGVGNSIRKYLSKNKVSPFLETNYFYEKNHISFFGFNFDSNSHKIRALGGIAYTGFKNLYGLELFLGAEKVFVNIPRINEKGDYYLPSGGIRFNYHF